jgi:hypothetical protein
MASDAKIFQIVLQYSWAFGLLLVAASVRNWTITHSTMAAIAYLPAIFSIIISSILARRPDMSAKWTLFSIEIINLLVLMGVALVAREWEIFDRPLRNGHIQIALIITGILATQTTSKRLILKNLFNTGLTLFVFFASGSSFEYIAKSDIQFIVGFIGGSGFSLIFLKFRAYRFYSESMTEERAIAAEREHQRTQEQLDETKLQNQLQLSAEENKRLVEREETHRAILGSMLGFANRLNSPLTTLLAAREVLKKRTEKLRETELDKNTEQILFLVDQMNSAVESLAELSHELRSLRDNTLLLHEDEIEVPKNLTRNFSSKNSPKN